VGEASGQSHFVRVKLREQLGKFLREKRGSQTLAQFARKLSLSDSSLQRLEIAQQNVTLDTLETILRRLGCKIADVFPNA
jgi:transcriptional regulator with XRE-family HTH domain